MEMNVIILLPRPGRMAAGLTKWLRVCVGGRSPDWPLGARLATPLPAEFVVLAVVVVVVVIVVSRQTRPLT